MVRAQLWLTGSEALGGACRTAPSQAPAAGCRGSGRRLRRAHPSSAGRSRTSDRYPSWRCMTDAARFQRHARPSRGSARLQGSCNHRAEKCKTACPWLLRTRPPTSTNYMRRQNIWCFPSSSRRWRVAVAAVCVALPIAASYGRPSKPQDLSDPELMSNAWDEPAILDAQPARNLRDVRSSTISHPPTTSRPRPRRHRRWVAASTYLSAYDRTTRRWVDSVANGNPRLCCVRRAGCGVGGAVLVDARGGRRSGRDNRARAAGCRRRHRRHRRWHRGRLRVRLLGIDTPETRNPATASPAGPRSDRVRPVNPGGTTSSAYPTPRTTRPTATFAPWPTSFAATAGTIRSRPLAPAPPYSYVYGGRPAARHDAIAAAEREAKDARRGQWGPGCNGKTASVLLWGPWPRWIAACKRPIISTERVAPQTIRVAMTPLNTGPLRPQRRRDWRRQMMFRANGGRTTWFVHAPSRQPLPRPPSAEPRPRLRK